MTEGQFPSEFVRVLEVLGVNESDLVCLKEGNFNGLLFKIACRNIKNIGHS